MGNTRKTGDLINNAITRITSSISANTTAGANIATDYTYFASGTITITLPTAVGNTNQYTIKNVAAGTGNTVTVLFTGGQTADGYTAVTMTDALSQNQSRAFISNGTNWQIVS